MSASNEAMLLLRELFIIRLERYKTELVKEEGNNIRGKAQELTELMSKIFTRAY